MRRCGTCGEVKEASAFTQNKKNPCGAAVRCKTCVSVLSRSYYQRNREKIKARSAATRARIKVAREQGPEEAARIQAAREQEPEEAARRERQAAYHVARKYWRTHQGDHAGLTEFLYRPADLPTMRERPPLFSLTLQSKI